MRKTDGRALKRVASIFRGGGSISNHGRRAAISPPDLPARLPAARVGPGAMPEVPAKFLAPQGSGGGKHRKRGKRKDGGGGKPNKAQGLGAGAPDRNDSSEERRVDGSDDADDSNSDDEGTEGYRKGGYHPVKIGEAFKDGRYVVRRKLGWGHFSTCWLCDDLETNATVALKVQKSASHYSEAARDEIEILKRIADTNTIDRGDEPEAKAKTQRPHHRPGKSANAGANRFGEKLRRKPPRGASSASTENVDDDDSTTTNSHPQTPSTPLHPGARAVVTLLDSFDHEGPHGTHVCMIFPVLGDNLLDVIKRFDYRGAPLSFVKQMSRDVLLALDYLHTRKKIIHTDLKPENVLLTRRLVSWEEVRAKESVAAEAVDRIFDEAFAEGEAVSDARCAAEAPGEVLERIVREAEAEVEAKNEGAAEAIDAAIDAAVARCVASDEAEESDAEEDRRADAGTASASPAADTADAGTSAAGGDGDDASRSEGRVSDDENTVSRMSTQSDDAAATETRGETRDAAPDSGHGKPRRAIVSRGRGPTPTAAELSNVECAVVDLGNACWTYKQFTQDIQTRQYRCPEVILGSKYGTAADVWSAACLVFELATGDLLFDPRSGKDYDRDEDHLALMMELVGRMPKKVATGGKRSREFFTRAGELRHIKSLKRWPLEDVLNEKYGFHEDEAASMADFLNRMLDFEPGNRATAAEALLHPWLDEVSPPRENENENAQRAEAAEAKDENGDAAEDAEDAEDAADVDETTSD
jgi:serine/threonine-protein kinase SRPK3